jgi:P4 family phage/plasmid primase-like protien
MALARIGIPTFLTYGIGKFGHCECGKFRCDRPGKHPRKGGTDRGATSDPAQIRRETQSGWANIALHCGLANLVVLDIDPRNGGWDTIAELEAQFGSLESAVVAETGGGGEHRYFRASEGISYPSSLGPGVDVLSGAKYPIIPPSRHHSGIDYRWRDDCDPISAGFLLTELRESVLDRFRPADDDDDDRLPLEPIEETDDEVARLQSALEFLSADCPRDEWRDHVFAINATGWKCAEELARDWSLTAPHRWSQSAFAELWESADPSRRGGRTIASIYFTAKRNGWIDPSAGPRLATLGDIDNGRRFAERYRGKLIYDRASRVWRQYVEGIWRPCDSGEHIAAAKDIADTILKEAGENLASNPTDANRAAHNQALRVHRHAQRVSATIEMAAAEPGMSVADPSAFDANPDLLGIEGGAIDLRTGVWLPPSANHRISKCVGVPFDPKARCPRFEAFMTEILANREEVEFVQRFAGYTLTGCVDEEALLFMQGQGANGKSVLANILSGVLGDYAVTVGSELLAVTKHESEVSRLKVRLRGVRMALVNEVGQNDTFNDQRVKEIVSREAISARYLYGEAFDFIPTHKLWVRGNHRPAVLDSGDGMWRRLILLPFLRQFEVEERVRDLDRQLLEKEGSGILNWCIAGCLEWRKIGLAIPPSISRETAQYRDETDVVGEWIEAECNQAPGVRCKVGTIYEAYRSYFHEAGMSPKSQVAFTRMMGARGFRRKSSNGKAYLEGIDLAL